VTASHSPDPIAQKAPADPLAGLELVIFDKDGTLIEFHSMWGGWLEELVAGLETAAGRPVADALFAAMGYDPEARRIVPGGRLAATPMAILREVTVDVVADAGLPPREAREAVGRCWLPPDPARLARPLADLPALFGQVRVRGGRIAVATTDDREPTLRTLDVLRIAGLVDAIICADDGTPVKPAPDMVLHLCTTLGVEASRTAVVGDTAADLVMGRAAGCGLVVAVLSGSGDRATLEPLADLVVSSIAELLPA
jgi:phosphoglycolate phosphatase